MPRHQFDNGGSLRHVVSSASISDTPVAPLRASPLDVTLLLETSLFFSWIAGIRRAASSIRMRVAEIVGIL